MTELNMVEAINSALMSEMRSNPKIIVLGEDVGTAGGVFRVTENLQKIFGKERVIDTPLAESCIVGASIGLAVNGMVPVAEIQFSGFIPPAFDQIITHAGRIRNRSRGTYSVPMVLRAPYGGGIHAPEHHSESMEAVLAHVPGIKVVIPSTPYDAKGLIISAIRDPDPVIFLEPKKIYRAYREDVPSKDYTIPLGIANIIQEGNDVTVISWGAMMHLTRKAVENLTGIELIDIRTISPLDIDTIVQSVKKTGRVVIVQEAPRNCGFASEIISIINDHALMHLEAPVERVTGFDTVVPLLKNEDKYFPDAKRIIYAIKKVKSV
jgi:pyruvate dehydrogenase E1 component beta subunit